MSAPQKRKLPKMQTPEDIARHIAGQKMLDAAFPVIEKHLGKLLMPVTTWRRANKTAALELHDIGITPEHVVKMLERCFADRYYPRDPMLAKLQRHWAAVKDRAKGSPRDAQQAPKSFTVEDTKRIR